MIYFLQLDYEVINSNKYLYLTKYMYLNVNVAPPPLTEKKK